MMQKGKGGPITEDSIDGFVTYNLTVFWTSQPCRTRAECSLHRALWGGSEPSVLQAVLMGTTKWVTASFSHHKK